MTPEFDTTQMTPADHAALMDAVRRLERVGLAMRVSNMLGRKLNAAKSLAPEQVAKIVDGAAMAAMRVALRTAIASLAGKPLENRNRAHKFMVAASGAAGGALGLLSLPVELPVTTTLMLRAIADIARAEGEDLANPEAALACLEVFALDGREASANVSDSGYFAIRGLLARTVSEAARYVAARGIIDETAPALVRLLATDRLAIWRRGRAEIPRPGDSGAWRGWWRGDQCRLHRPFPVARQRPFHGTAA